jgi:hypothetical protein
MTYRQIGKELGVSGNEARYLVLKEQARIKKMAEIRHPLWEAMKATGDLPDSIHAWNSLQYSGGWKRDREGHRIIDAAGLAALGGESLLKRYGIGKKRGVCIARALQSMGLIEDAERWLFTRKAADRCPTCGAIIKKKTDK